MEKDDLGLNPCSTLTSYGISGRLFNLSVPDFPHIQNRDIEDPTTQGCSEDKNEVILQKYLEQDLPHRQSSVTYRNDHLVSFGQLRLSLQGYFSL